MSKRSSSSGTNSDNQKMDKLPPSSSPPTPPIPPSKSLIITGIILYVLTGILQPILIDTLHIHNLLRRSWLLLHTLANTTGMALCGFLTHSTQRNEFRKLLTASLPQMLQWWTTRKIKSKGSNNNNNNGSFLLRMILLTAFVDLLSGMCLTLGLLTTGGAIFVILYNSCPIWTTLLSWMFLSNFTIGWVSLGGIVLVSFGLIVNVFGSHVLLRGGGDEGEGEVIMMEEEVESSSSSSSRIFIGSIIILVGSLLHSFMFVLSDLTLRPSSSSSSSSSSSTIINRNTATTQIVVEQSREDEDKDYHKDDNDDDGGDGDDGRRSAIHTNHAVVPTGFMWLICLGTIEASLMLLWVSINILLYGFRDESTSSSIDTNPSGNDGSSSSNSSTLQFATGFAFLIAVDAIHAATFFSILQHVGAVGSALLKGVQVIVVVALSSLFFCNPADKGGGGESSQCLTYGKVYSVSLVSLGVFCYGVGRKSSSTSGGGKEEGGSYTSGKKMNCFSKRKTDRSETELRTLL